MKYAEVESALGIDRHTLKAWIAEGLPIRATEDKISEWLVANGKARPGRIARSSREAAEMLGGQFTQRKVENLSRNPGFPAQPGHWDVDAIEEWLENRYARLPDEKGASLSIQDQVRLWRLEKEKGKYVEVERMITITNQQHAYAVSEFNTLPAKIEAIITGAVNDEIRLQIMEHVRQTIDTMIEILAEKFTDADEDVAEDE